MELFRLLGTILVDDTRAKASLDETGKRAKITADQMATAFKKVGSKSIELGKKLTWVSTGAATAFGGMVKFASDTEEAANKVDVAFGKASKSVEKFSDTALTQFGIAKGTAMDMAALFGDMGTSMGLSKKQAAEMSIELVGLAGDLASFKNIGIDQATTALNGIFTGETESLKSLGIVMTQTNLDAYALANGFGKTTKEMTQAELVALRYAYVMDKTKNAQGDFARTGDSTANQLRKFKEGLKELSASFGEVVLPYVAKAVDVANKFVQAFSKAPEPIKKLVVALIGIVAIASPFLIVFGSVCNGIGSMINLGTKLAPVLTKVTGAIKGLNLAFLANPVFWVIAGIVALVAAIVIAYKKSEKFRQIVQQVGVALKEGFHAAMEKITPVVNKVVGSIKKAIAIFNSFKGIISGVFGSIYSSIKTKMDNASKIIQFAANKIKNIFKNLKLKIDLKIPKISLSGGKAPWGIAGKGQLPKFNVTWYKKAMDNPMLLDQPTIFGYGGGNFLAAGEAGKEVVSGADKLMSMISNAVSSRNTELIAALRTVMGEMNLSVTIPFDIDGKRLATLNASNTLDAINKIQMRNDRLVGVR